MLHVLSCASEILTVSRNLERPHVTPASLKPIERLPSLNYFMLSESNLRKKLDSLGIPAWGQKPLLIRRHKEWVDMFNANCDSSKPRMKRELLRGLDTWERTQGGNASSPSARDDIMAKDFDGAAWAGQNSADFRRLIAQAREKRNPQTSGVPGASKPELDSDSVGPSSSVDYQKASGMPALPQEGSPVA